ncbi:uncharacterized protein BDV14DRAFT_184077 [Aspergillus stella-maris]|uniref:uncharacterized protein n=1 Tax=Aspergillus stella-maris TaxID=1810926 RepID=UPI003CCCAAF2
MIQRLWLVVILMVMQTMVAVVNVLRQKWLASWFQQTVHRVTMEGLVPCLKTLFKIERM